MSEIIKEKEGWCMVCPGRPGYQEKWHVAASEEECWTLYINYIYYKGDAYSGGVLSYPVGVEIKKKEIMLGSKPVKVIMTVKRCDEKN